MIRNYHTHTTRCRHARGTEREFIERAIADGRKVIGFSDHSPYLFSDGYYSTFRMYPEELEGYVTTILALKEEYRRDIEIHVGLEMEYYPAFYEKTIRFMEDYPLEYALLGQHCLGNEMGEHFSGRYTEDPALLRRFVDQVIEAIHVGRWLYIAHPDIFNFPTDRPVYKEEMRRLCVAAKEQGVPLEINLLGLSTHRNYPNHAFWEIAAEVGNVTVLGEDAHWIDEPIPKAAEETALSWVRELGLNLADSFALAPWKNIGLR